MKKQNNVFNKTLSIFLSFALLVGFMPIASVTNVAVAEEITQAQDDSAEVEVAELKTSEEFKEDADGLVVSADEVSHQALAGGIYSLFDRSDVTYNVKETSPLENSGKKSLKASTLPNKVDLRDFGDSHQNRVTSVKDQGSTETCWAFSSSATSETSIATSKNTNETVDFSPFQTSYFAYTALSTDTSTLKGTEVTQAGEGLVWGSDEFRKEYALGAGSMKQASSQYFQGVGPAKATDIPFPTSDLNSGDLTTFLTQDQRRTSVARLSKWSWLGSLINTTTDLSGNKSYASTNETVLNRMKSELNNGNPIEISFCGDNNGSVLFEKYIDTTNWAHYTYEYQQSNHAVCVVGYDDTYSKSNFIDGHQPDKDGAFIVKNSWGSSWGNSGYFYLSYYDQSIDSAATYTYDVVNYDGTNIDTNKELIDQYDYLSAEDVYASGSQNEKAQWYSNVFTASKKQKLHTIGTYYCSSGKTLNYKVYKLKSDATTPSDVQGSLSTPAAQGTYVSDYEGFASIKLNTAVDLKKGEKYAIWISQQNDAGEYCAPQAIASKQASLEDGTKVYSNNAVINSGESFYFATSSNTWKTLANSFVDVDDWTYTVDNYCIKGYATAQDLTVTFDSNGGSEVSSKTVKEGGTVKKPADPSKTGHDFIAWYKDEAFTETFSFETETVNDDLVLYAKFVPYYYYVFFYSNGGSSVSNQYLAYNSLATEPTTTKSGYKLDGWYTKDGSSDGEWGTKFNFAKNRITDATYLYAKWVEETEPTPEPVDPDPADPDPVDPGPVDPEPTPVTYTVTFNSNGGSAVTKQTVQNGNCATKPANPTRSGYTFAGWYADSALTFAFNFSTAITKSITLYAKWTKNATPNPTPTPTPKPTPSTNTVTTLTMHRLYNKYTGEHFYTSDSAEHKRLVAVGWSDEGVGWKAPSTSSKPVYRLYNKYVLGGDHHYTMNATERDSLVKAGWKYEGIGWYSDTNQGVALYRQYNPFAQVGTHNYTTSKAENTKLVKLGWREEGIAWYGVK